MQYLKKNPSKAFFRLVCYCIGLFCMAMGAVLSVNSNLGVSPVTSFPYIISTITGFTLGNCVTTMFCIYILLQILILRRDFKLINLTQIIVATVYGWFVDFCRFLLGDFCLPGGYLGRLGMLGISLVVIAVGMNFYLLSGLIILPPDGLSNAIAAKTHKEFHTIKMITDCTYVTLGLILSLIFLHNVTGLREGTVITALCVGPLMPVAKRFVRPLVDKFCA